MAGDKAGGYTSKSRRRLIIALGGNAILQSKDTGTYQQQNRNILKTMRSVAKLAASGKYEIVITHGNGPQVGNLLIQQHAAMEMLPEMPMHMCGAMTQGQIGFLIQQNLQNLFKKMGKRKEVVTVITQVAVDAKDNAFKNPTKPVGPYYTKIQAQKMMRKNPDFTFKEDAGRGWRRVVPSPLPGEIVEIKAIKKLLENGFVVVASGGGGIPVVSNHKLTGIDAVIDKDRAAALLADKLDADMLIILTAVEKVFVNFQKEDQKALDKVTVEEVEKYMNDGQFAEGSMKPKIASCIAFVSHHTKRQALITHAYTLIKALSGKTGTLIKRG